MTETYFPFDAGNGADVREAQWRKMGRLWRGVGVVSGYLNSLEVYADSSGMQVKVKTGQAWMDGFYYENDAELILAVGAAHPTYGRLDRVVLRLDVANNTCNLAILAGTPSASPALPSLTQSLTGTYEIALATITVDAAAITIAAGKVADTRTYSYAPVGSALGTADYDSGWFAAAYGGNTYIKAHGMGVAPRVVELYHSAVASPGATDQLVRIVMNYGSSGQVDALCFEATNVIYVTGSDASAGVLFSRIRSSGGGYIRMQAWK